MRKEEIKKTDEGLRTIILYKPKTPVSMCVHVCTCVSLMKIRPSLIRVINGQRGLSQQKDAAEQNETRRHLENLSFLCCNVSHSFFFFSCSSSTSLYSFISVLFLHLLSTSERRGEERKGKTAGKRYKHLVQCLQADIHTTLNLFSQVCCRFKCQVPHVAFPRQQLHS